MDHSQVVAELADYVRTELLGDDRSTEVAPDTPLLEWGILNSMNTARLLTHIREKHGVNVPPTYLVGNNFRDLSRIADMVVQLSAAA
jgi:acyl carrier protein